MKQLLLLFLTQSLCAEVQPGLELKAYFINEPVFKYVIDIAKTGDQEKLEEAFGKIEKNSTDQGDVRTLLSKEIKSTYYDEGRIKGATIGSHEVGLLEGSNNKKVYLGSKFKWTPVGMNNDIDHLREYDLKFHTSGKIYHEIQVKLVGNMKTDWTLAAGVKFDKGGVVIFERAFGDVISPKKDLTHVSVCASSPGNGQAPVSWWESESKPSFCLSESENNRENYIKSRSMNYDLNRDGLFDTDSSFHLSGEESQKLKYRIDVSISSLFDSKRDSFRWSEMNATIRVDQSKSLPSIFRVFEKRVKSIDRGYSSSVKDLTNRKKMGKLHIFVSGM